MKNKKILIVGERFAKDIKTAIPFKNGQSARRVRNWFNKNTYEDMIKVADIINAIPKYSDYDTMMNYIKIRDYSIIFLLGRIAQRVLFSNLKKDITTITHNDRIFVLLPHPSGRNFSCNHKDKKIKKFVERILNES